jgi:Phage P22-like portal protein
MPEQKRIETAKKRFEACVENERENRKIALEDLKFRAGDQWPGDQKKARELDGRPCLTINRIPQFLRQVTNDMRQNRPGVQVDPVDDNGDPETAEVIEGMVRNIQNDSNADIAYDTAAGSAATIGFGFIRVITEYESPLSFDQVIKIKRIRNPFMVYLDPSAQEADKSDAKFGFVVEVMTKEEYLEAYPDSKLADADDWKSIGDDAGGWIDEEGGVRVAEYFDKTIEDDTVLMMQCPDGTKQAKLLSEFPESMRASLAGGAALPEGYQILASRNTKVPKLKWCKLNGHEILDETDWPGQYIPIVPVYGDELDVDGKVIFEGVVRHAKDPQRMYNYWASAETETIALAPKAPYVAAEGQIEGYEEQWRNANRKNYSVLTYKPKGLAGELLPPPQRNVQEPAVAAITQARMQSGDDLKATTGIYDAALGARSNEQTGRAILARQQQGQVSNFHYMDNLCRAIRHVGRIIVDLIPKIYDTPRVLRIIGSDEEAKTVPINQQVDKPIKQGGVANIYDVTTGRYDVTVKAGPSYSTKRQEAAQSMLALTQAYPQLMQVAGDLLVKNMDWPGAREIADRLKKTLPQQLQENPNGQDAPIPPQLQQAMQQLQDQNNKLTQALNQASDEIEQKKFELESRERIEMEKIRAQLLMKEADVESRGALVQMQAELKAIGDQMAHLRQLSMMPDSGGGSTQSGAPAPAGPAAPQQPSPDMAMITS